jgi:hypothetical protein
MTCLNHLYPFKVIVIRKQKGLLGLCGLFGVSTLMADKKRVTVCLNGDQENQKCMLVPNDWGLFVVNIRTKFSLKESHVKVSHF